MIDLIRSQIDFIYFVYGLAFFLLLPICLLLNRRPGSRSLDVAGGVRRRPWGARVVGPGGPEPATDPIFDVIRLVLLILSFLLLAEFGRASIPWSGAAVRGAGSWPHSWGWPCWGPSPAFPASGPQPVTPWGWWALWAAAAALWLAAHRATTGRRALQGAALCLAGYAAAAGLVVDPAPFFPASWLNTEVFLAATGVPIQLGAAFWPSASAPVWRCLPWPPWGKRSTAASRSGGAT